MAADWEAGRRFPTAEDTLRHAGRLGVDVAAAFATFDPKTAPLHGDLAAWLSVLQGARTHQALAEAAGLSRQQVGRWLRGDAAPRLPQFLALVEALTGRAVGWVAALVDLEAVPVLADRDRAARQVRNLVLRAPWTGGLLPLLEVAPDMGTAALAARLGASADEVGAVVEDLLAAGMLAREDAGLRVVRALTVDTFASQDQWRQLRRFWAEAALARIDAGAPSDQFSFNVFGISRPDLERVRALQKRYYQELRDIVADSSPTEAVVVTAWHLVELGPLPEQ